METRQTGWHWSPKIDAALKAAGWPRDDQNMERLKEWKAGMAEFSEHALPEVVTRALSEFGGIELQADGPGIDCARSGFDIDPSLAFGEEDRFAAHSRRIGSRLFPIGEALNGNAFLGMDEVGRVFLVGDQITLVADNVYEGLEALWLGLMPRGVPIG